DLLHPGNGLRAAGAAFDGGERPAGTGAGRVENRFPRGISRDIAAGSISDCAQQRWRGWSLPGGSGAASFRCWAGSLSAGGVWSAPSAVEDSVGGVADAVFSGRGFYFSGAGG